MTVTKRYGFTASERADLWDRFRRGESFNEFGRILSKDHGSIRSVVQATGGFAPRERKRSECSLKLNEREEISRGIAQGLSFRVIAEHLGVRPPASAVK